jgi:predicted exporter
VSIDSRQIALRAVFLIFLVLLCLAGLRIASHGVVIKNDLISLLPETDSSLAVTEASQRMTAAVGDIALWVVGGEDLDDVVAAGEFVQRKVNDAPGLRIVDFQTQIEDFLDYGNSLKPHRFGLLRDEQLAFLKAKSEEDILAARLQQLYQPAPNNMIATIAEDPLGLFTDFITGVGGDAADIYPLGNLAVLETEEASYVLISARVEVGAFDLEIQQRVLGLDAELNQSLAELKGDLSLWRAGAVFHAARASARARAEMSFIATGSIVGILVLFILAFRSVRPLLLSLASVLFGCASATLLTLSLYPQLHLLTLVFGASLIGVAVDYSLHYLTYQNPDARLPDARKPAQHSKLEALLPALWLALLTSVIGFGSLLQAPIPGLRQMAVFSMLGLMSTWLFVVVVLPLLAGPTSPPSKLIRAIALAPVQFHAIVRNYKMGLLILILPVGLGLSQLQLGADLRVLYEVDEQLVMEQKFIESLVPGYSANQFFLLHALDDQQLLQRCELLSPELGKLQDLGVIAHFLSPCDYLPSMQAQRENAEFLSRGVYGRGGVADQVLGQVGFEEEAVEAFHRELEKSVPLSSQQWQSAVPPDIGRTLLGQFNGQFYAMVQLQEIQALSPLARLAEGYPWLEFTDTVSDISENLLERQQLATGLLGLAYAIIGVALLVRYRKWSSLKLLLLPALSSVIAVGAVGLTAAPLSLFHVFALFLVLGLGMDYSIFFYEAAAEREDCLLAVLLSFATSALSFGLLTFSSTPMIAAFGFVVLIGSLGNWLLLPMVRKNRTSVQ